MFVIINKRHSRYFSFSFVVMRFYFVPLLLIFFFTASLSNFLRCKLRSSHTRVPIISSVVFLCHRFLFTPSNLLLSPQCFHLFIIVFLRLSFVPFVYLFFFSFSDVFLFLSFLFAFCSPVPSWISSTNFIWFSTNYLHAFTREPWWLTDWGQINLLL